MKGAAFGFTGELQIYRKVACAAADAAAAACDGICLSLKDDLCPITSGKQPGVIGAAASCCCCCC